MPHLHISYRCVAKKTNDVIKDYINKTMQTFNVNTTNESHRLPVCYLWNDKVLTAFMIWKRKNI